MHIQKKNTQTTYRGHMQIFCL